MSDALQSISDVLPLKLVTDAVREPWLGIGDGTGPLGAVVDYAASRGIVWFNSGGNDAFDLYMRRPVPTDLAPGDYVDFDAGPAVDTWLRLDAGLSTCGVLLDGIRWSNDWYLPADQRTDYSLEFWEPTSGAHEFEDHYNPPSPAEVVGLDVRPDLPAIPHVIGWGLVLAAVAMVPAACIAFFVTCLVSFTANPKGPESEQWILLTSAGAAFIVFVGFAVLIGILGKRTVREVRL